MTVRGVKWMAAAGLLLAGLSILLSALLFSRVASQQDAVEQQRVNITYQACAEQNTRHDRTVKQLDALVARIPDSTRRRRAERSVSGTVTLIDALAPRQDCLKLVRRRYGSDARPEA